MPKQTTDRNTTWFINQNNKEWTLVPSATINVNNQDGIYEAGSGNQINVLGDIVVKGMSYSGVHFQGSSSEVEVGANSVVNASQATYGIFSEGAGSNIVNRGIVRGGNEGIHGNIWNDVSNFGTVRGAYGMVFEGDGSQIYNHGKIDSAIIAIDTFASGTYVFNGKNGIIDSNQIGVNFAGTGDVRLVNRGLITAEDNAVQSQDSALDLINRGKIVGDVTMGDGQDMFDARGGILNGRVFGGDDNDTYFVSTSNIKIVELSGEGLFDKVISSADYTLSANIEYLFLKGNKNIDGKGNASNNYLEGNSGDNTLFGESGMDDLNGRAGNDTLRGGGDADTFYFGAGYDVDRIKGYQDGIDHLMIGTVDTQAEFDALNIKQVGSDVVINLGNGDKLIIENRFESDITFNGDITYVV